MSNSPKILVTGAFGQIGSELVPELQKKFGEENVISLGHINIADDFKGKLEVGDVTDKDFLERVIKKHKINTIYHMVSILSANGEKNPKLAWQVNMGLKDILDLSVDNNIKLFWPSSIAAFGETTPRKNTPQHTVLEPTTMYGVTKVAGELLCQYYHQKFGLDVRSVRYPGLISWKTPPGGGTTDYAVAIFYDGLTKGEYECFVKEDTILPMMYMDDAVRGTIEIMDADAKDIKIRTSYNLAAISFTAKELEESIKRYMSIDVRYNPDGRQKIADSWPDSIDDSTARKDWGWEHKFDLDKMTDDMIKNLRLKFNMN